MKKVYDSASAALDGLLHDGMLIAAGGFGLCGIPELLIDAVRDSGVKNLTIASNNCGVDGFGLGKLLETRQISKMISSYVGENDLFMKQYLSGELEIEFNPQGTLAERIRAGGAGIPAFFTATGVGTVVAEGKEVREFYPPRDDTKLHNRHPRATGTASMLDPKLHQEQGTSRREYVMETGLFADLALVKAWKADTAGNLIYRRTARNFNPNMATAGKVTVAEVEEIVPVGSLDPEAIHTPGIYVDRLIKSTINEKKIEKLTERKRETA